MIGLKGIYDAYNVRGASAGGAVRRNEASEAAQPSAGGLCGDVIEISADAALRAQTDAAAKTSAAANAVSDTRLAALKVKYAGDSCPVSAQDTARALLGHISGQKGDSI